MKFASRREDLTFHSEGECDASFVSKSLGRQDWGDAAESDGLPGRLEIGQDTLNLGIHSHVSSWNQFMNYVLHMYEMDLTIKVLQSFSFAWCDQQPFRR